MSAIENIETLAKFMRNTDSTRVRDIINKRDLKNLASDLNAGILSAESCGFNGTFDKVADEATRDVEWAIDSFNKGQVRDCTNKLSQAMEDLRDALSYRLAND